MIMNSTAKIQIGYSFWQYCLATVLVYDYFIWTHILTNYSREITSNFGGHDGD